MISAVEAMTHFSYNLNHPSTFRIAQGSSPTVGRLPPSSTLLVVVPSSAATAGVLPIVAGLPVSLTNQDRGAGGKSAHVSLGPLSSTQTLVDKGK